MTLITPLLIAYVLVGVGVGAATFAKSVWTDLSADAQGGSFFKVTVLCAIMLTIGSLCWPMFLVDWLAVRSKLRTAPGDWTLATTSHQFTEGLIRDNVCNGTSGAAYLAALVANRRVERAVKPASCPTCGHMPVADVLYGMPEHISIVDIERGRVILGGCLFSSKSPRWRCSRCNQAICEPAEGR